MAKKVIVIGGGVAGMSAAHELIERGFEVEVYERRFEYCGGKARSVNFFGHNKEQPYAKPLPGEHGFRFFPGFYCHLPDTMSRIPFTDTDGKKSTVLDNLVATNRMEIARYGKQPIKTISNFPHSFASLKFAIESVLNAHTGLTAEEKNLFIQKIWQLMSSCWDRRANDYERLSWWEFMEADKHSETYRSLLVEGITRSLVAANARYASTKTDGDIILQMIFNITSPWVNADRVLNGPTNERWLTPWLEYLRSKGVKYHFGTTCTEILYDNKTDLIRGVKMRHNLETISDTLVTGDYYILAVPVERAADLITDEMVEHDDSLAGMDDLGNSVAWMNGLQFYLNVDVPVVHGHVMYVDSEWAITSISQIQFWKNYDIEDRGNGQVRGILSIDISNWTSPCKEGKHKGKIAKECTPEEIKEVVWDQLKKSLNIPGQPDILRDDMIVDWFLDGDIKTRVDKQGKREDTNSEPLLVNRVNTWSKRPEAYTSIDNFFLAGDYVRTYTDLATMEGANESARRAVNGIIDHSGANVPYCKIWNLHEPFWLKPYKWFDVRRYRKGLPYKIYQPFWFPFFFWVWKMIMNISKYIFNVKRPALHTK